ncbi:hypothetical protein TcasGA2_TC006650 [Tribolium castaneum]|uniref:Uncharacterized protein n=1 Tax=Tribolium castaneum TaxID=7070 RepID=D6WY39_TRICA|nr:hypothetical protein TcasGA2_TC006650 [Tribolium castaneum]
MHLAPTPPASVFPPTFRKSLNVSRDKSGLKTRAAGKVRKPNDLAVLRRQLNLEIIGRVVTHFGLRDGSPNKYNDVSLTVLFFRNQLTPEINPSACSLVVVTRP